MTEEHNFHVKAYHWLRRDWLRYTTIMSWKDYVGMMFQETIKANG